MSKPVHYRQLEQKSAEGLEIMPSGEDGFYPPLEVPDVEPEDEIWRRFRASDIFVSSRGAIRRLVEQTNTITMGKFKVLVPVHPKPTVLVNTFFVSTNGEVLKTVLSITAARLVGLCYLPTDLDLDKAAVYYDKTKGGPRIDNLIWSLRGYDPIIAARRRGLSKPNERCSISPEVLQQLKTSVCLGGKKASYSVFDSVHGSMAYTSDLRQLSRLTMIPERMLTKHLSSGSQDPLHGFIFHTFN